jgi:HD-GYP domain-containing protein (c-di-GMP phosphodiesterase class II)
VPVALKERTILNEMRSYHAESAEHSVRVGQYAQLSAKELGLPWGEQSEATHTGLMHDAGKLDMPMSALDENHTGILSEEQWQFMHQHPIKSFERLQKVPYKGVLRNVPTDAMQHHEWINGTGYPHNLTGEQMRMAAKVVPPVDVFDAITSGRAYMNGERVPLGKVKQIIDGGRGTHFEPAAVDSLWSIPADKAIACSGISTAQNAASIFRAQRVRRR